MRQRLCLLANRFLNLRRRLEGSGHPAVRAIQAVLDDIEGVSRTDFPHQWCEFATFTFGLMLTHEPDLEGLKYRLGRDGVDKSMGDPAFAVSSGPHGQDGGRNADKTLLQ